MHRKRKNSDSTLRDSKKRQKDRNCPSPEANEANSTVDLSQEQHHNPRKGAVRVPSSPPSPRPRPYKVAEQSSHKDFFVYRFLDAAYSSYEAPEIGTPGPVEEIASVSFPGKDDQFYLIPDGHIVPEGLVAQFDLDDIARQHLQEIQERMPSEDDRAGQAASDLSFLHLSPPPPAQCPRPHAESPETYLEVGSPEFQATQPSKANVTKSGHSRSQAAEPKAKVITNDRSIKFKGRYMVSDSEEENIVPDDDQDQDFVPESEKQARQVDARARGYNRRDSSDPIEDADREPHQVRTDANVVEEMEQEEVEARDEGAVAAEVVDDIVIPEAWKKGGQPTKAFIRDSVAVGEAFDKMVSDIMTTHGVSAKLAYSAIGYHPRTIETRDGSSWNAHQRVYKIKQPKVEGETVAEFRARSTLDYDLKVKFLAKNDKAKFKGDAAAKVLQKTAQMISRADPELQSFGGVNYIGHDKAGRTSGGATFVSSDVVLQAIKMFDIETNKIMITTGDFLQAVVAQEGMRKALAASSLTEPAEIIAKEKPMEARKEKLKGMEGMGQAREHLLPNEARPCAAASEGQPPHVVTFEKSDARKRARSYLGLSYSRVEPTRVTVDWSKLPSNALTGKFRLENWCFDKFPGQDGFAPEKILPRQWQDMGRRLVAEDFHPVTGGCSEKCPRFVPWSDEEKVVVKGSEEYYGIPIIVSDKGKVLLTAHEAEMFITRAAGSHARAACVEGEEAHMPSSEAHQASPTEKMYAACTISPMPALLPSAPSRTTAAPREAPTRTAVQHDSQPHESKQRKEDKKVMYTMPPLRGTAFAPNVATSSRQLHHRGDLGSGQHKKIIYANPSPVQASSLTSATKVFYGNTNAAPPSSRGLAYTKPKHSGQQASGVSHPTPGPSTQPKRAKAVPPVRRVDYGE
ncbi:hypothetical protein CPB84DRAFT_1856884 [Gymnopilus junonius]|uniref:Uncharacterized protein n=1 Tax=Gymnopilus junonius TaxID=109634 RepID=A0A9P5N8H3_GYMJU|nr:hypothetical protein CPB84DRAFT_1856884 [Gymnopilus junonius]